MTPLRYTATCGSKRRVIEKTGIAVWEGTESGLVGANGIGSRTPIHVGPIGKTFTDATDWLYAVHDGCGHRKGG